jgi:hypothetical protein
MARRSILTPALEEQANRTAPEPGPVLSEEPIVKVARTTKPSRIAKLHLGGYYNPDDPSIIAFQKLGIDLRRSQQDMLLEAVRDFVARHEASRAFNN